MRDSIARALYNDGLAANYEENWQEVYACAKALSRLTEQGAARWSKNLWDLYQTGIILEILRKREEDPAEGMTLRETAREWVDCGFSPELVEAWLDLGVTDPDTARLRAESLICP